MRLTRGRRARTLSAATASLVLTALSHPAVCQPALPVGPGARVRVSHTDRCCASPQVGALVSVSADSVVVRAGREPQTTVIALPRRAVSSFALGYEAGHYTRRGVTIGAVTGLLIGVARGLTFNCEGDEICESFRPLLAGRDGILFGVGGLLLGAALGRSITREKWVPVPLPERVGLAPSRSGLWVVIATYRLPRP